MPNRAYLEETFVDRLPHYFGITTGVRDDLLITTEPQFRSVLMAEGTTWMLSPVCNDGYTGHAVVVSNGHWYDSAVDVAKLGRGLNMSTCDWQKDVSRAYDWRQL